MANEATGTRAAVPDGVGGAPSPARDAATVTDRLRGGGLPDIGALVSLAAAVALGVGLVVFGLRPDWVAVAEQGGRDDAIEIVAALRAAGVEHRVDPRSGLVLVPDGHLGEARMTLAASGFSSDDTVGLEMLDREPSLGLSHYTEVRRYQHALETELARTLSRLRNVAAARVHLALPKQSVFVRDADGASASVTLEAEPGRRIEEEEVDAVTRLVAASIANLEPGDVTVVDQLGQLLSDADDADGVSRARYRHARQLERLYASRIEALLTPIVGVGRIRATVTADIDFTENERTEEQYTGDPGQVRSEQTESQTEAAADAAGVPGTLVNQPPGDGTLDPTAPDGPGVGSTTVAESATRNYELDRTITRSRVSPGAIRRLSAAVIVDDRFELDADGEPVRRGFDDDEIAAFTALVREAIGFDAARGDTVIVSNRAFLAETPIEPLPPLPFWQQPWLAPLLRQGFIGVAVLMLVLVGVRPALRKLTAPPLPAPVTGADDERSGNGDDAHGTGASSTASAQRLDAPDEVYGDILNMARAMAQQDPKRVARLVKDWVADG